MEKKLFVKPLYLIFAITLFSTGVIVNVIQILAFLLIRPFNLQLFRQINYYCAYAIFSQFVFIGHWWATVDFKIYTKKSDFDRYFGKEHTFAILNHVCEIDWILGQCFLDNIAILGNMKAFMKSVVKYIPIIGWIYYFTGTIFLQRSFEKDKDVIKTQVAELASYKDPVWLALFPEGTRFSPGKHEAALAFLRARNLPDLHHHLAPRMKGFTASVPHLRHSFPAIYDVELVFGDNGVVPNLQAIMSGKHLEASMYIERIPMDKVPETEAGQEQFLREIFYKKDKILASFKQTGDFFKTSNVPRTDVITLKRRLQPLINYIFWFTISVGQIVYYLIKLLFYGELVKLLICVSIISVCYILLNKCMSAVVVKPDNIKNK